MNEQRKPEIIPPSAHHIPPSAISDSAVKVIEQLNQAGYRAYLVGGCVRDLLLQHHPKDFDVATDARPEQVKELFPRCRLIGRRFRLAHVYVGRSAVEVATFRGVPDGTETVDSDHARVTASGQIMRDNVYGTMGEDALRRDFTVNALYYDLEQQSVIDYTQGAQDVQNRILRTIGDPAERFREDPVRMLRAVRFSSKLGFTIDPDALSALKELASLLHHVPPARMLDEVIKLFHSGFALQTYQMLREVGLFRYLFPFTEQCLGVEPNLPSLALANTDKRIHAGKPVTPAFLFACLLWEPLHTDAEKLEDSGLDRRNAFVTASRDVVRDQSQYVSIPRRLSMVMHEIWSMQATLERRQPRNIKRLLAHKRFRAAYDFLLLRAEVNEVTQELASWWTQIQELDEGGQQRMIKDLSAKQRNGRGGRRKRRRRNAESQAPAYY